MFEKKGKKSKRCIGLYMCLDAFYISQSIIKGNKIQVEQFVKMPIHKTFEAETGGHTSAMNVDFFLSEEYWLKPLNNAIKNIKWNTKNVVITLSPSFAVIRHFVMPFVERRFWRQSIPFEAKKYIPFSFEESIYDYYVYRFKDEQTQDSKLGVVFGFTDKKISSTITNALPKIGLNLVAIEVSAVSAQRFFDILDKEKTSKGGFRAHFDESSAYFLLSNNSIPLLFRVVNFGQSQMTERRRLGLRGSVDFIHKQLGSKIYEEINLSGANLEFWKNVVKEDTKLKIKVCQPESALNMKNANWGTYASLGAAARQAVQSVSDIDIRANVKEDLTDKIAVSFLWKIAGVLTGFVFAAFLYYQVRLQYLNIKSVVAAKNTEVISELQGLSAAEIERSISDFRGRLETISFISKDMDYFTPKLEAVVNSIPSRVWLESVSYSYALRTSSSKGASNKMMLDGGLNAKNKEEEIALANEFKEAFQKESAIASVYAGIGSKINLDYKSSEEDGTEGHSNFRITCTKSEK
jgi:hypothetical protein